MPVSGEYTWSESEGCIEVSIPLKGVSAKKVDVFTTSMVLKVSYPPFLLDLNLHDEIDEDSSRAVLENGTLKIRLSKRNVGRWGRPQFIGTKEEINERRRIALQERDAKVQREMDNVSQKKVEEERMVFRKHMALEEKERLRLDEIKATQKKDAEDAMHDAFSRLQNVNACEEPLSNIENARADRIGVLGKDTASKSSVDGNLWKKVDARPNPQDCAGESIKHEIKAKLGVPPPRQAVQNSFKHTPRFFKTPSRESTDKQEQEFIIKNSAHLRKNALLNSGDIGDVDPVWLTAKGNEFYGKGDYCSAINAFTEALRADEKLVPALGGRAACYLHLREGACCVKDCLATLNMNEAIETHFDTAFEQTMFRAKIHIRLALAFCLLGEYDNSMEHFTKARKLDETDEVAMQGMRHLETFIEANRWKEKADECFEGNPARANELYSKALLVYPMHTKALMNRAACHLLMKNSADCIDDCEFAISQCKRRGSDSSLISSMLLPRPCVQRKWMVALLCRRAAAKELGKDFQGALEDLEEAKNTIRPTDDIDTETVEKSIERFKKGLEF
jgi:dyslexia susceptibility 1 candidate gene 1 protein